MKRSLKIYLFLCLFTLGAFLLMRFVPPVTDAYIRYVFPLFIHTVGRFSGLFPFAVGGVLLFLTLLLFLIFIVLGILVPVTKKKLAGTFKHYAVFLAWYILVVVMTLTFFWWVLYRATPMGEKYEIGQASYTKDELLDCYNEFVTELNALCDTVPRDPDGRLVMTEGLDIHKEAVTCLQAVSDLLSIPELDGFYPGEKPMMFSHFFSQQGVLGYYFPVTIEANINTDMTLSHTPFVTCHELSHLKGFILEDEADFIAFMSTRQSSDPYFRYSGMLGIMHHMIRALSDNDIDSSKAQGIDDRCFYDNTFLYPEVAEEIEEEALIPTEIVRDVADTVREQSLIINGVEDGQASYGRMVDLYLRWYFTYGKT